MMSITVWRTQPEGGQAAGFIVPGASQPPWTVAELRLALSEGFGRCGRANSVEKIPVTPALARMESLA
jgi:hypothetical protein